ncbi:Protein STB2 [Apiospora aurea]|uniref:Protein STB2 n=1 Tax=Apiospora aurea TaxID=335848 RepID=A0ABR1QQS2_9PEZI
MAFRFPMSTSDPRMHREEDLTLLRKASQRNTNLRASPQQPDGTVTPAPAPDSTQTTPAAESSPSTVSHRRQIVLADPVAFRYLEEDPSVNVIERRSVLRGYELYMVEQWACSRSSPTLVIVTYTGDEKHSVVVGVLDVPQDESTWSSKLRVYFKAIQQFHARPKGTPLGELMLTNLSSFPSALTVIPVPDGDIKLHRQEFIVNEDLKRLGCSGRSGMTLSEPTPAAKAKFLQLYKTNEKITFAEAVIELVKLCQVALMIFGKLEQDYIDGLLCDVTETAIGDWWTEFGTEYYNIEPTDGILGPTTVAALLGLLMGARNRLSYFGAPMSKDVFDIDATKRGISYFQKYQKIERNRRLDRQTLHKLHGATAKAAAGEGWGVQKAVKSTVTEIGGKRGELVLGMVGGRDKGGIGDIETLDLERFISLAHGERAKWLWYGKPKRTAMEQQERTMPDLPNMLLEEPGARRKEDSPAVYSGTVPGSATSVAADSPGEREALRRGVFKSVAGKMSDARSGLGRIKDAVSGAGGRGHGPRPSRDESSGTTAYSGTDSGFLSPTSGLIGSPTPTGIGRAFTWKNKPEEYRDGFRRDLENTSSAPVSVGGFEKLDLLPEEQPSVIHEGGGKLVLDAIARPSQTSKIRNEVTKLETSVAGMGKDNRRNLQGPALGIVSRLDSSVLQLHRRHSVAGLESQASLLNENRWPRRLSFGDAEEAVLTWTELATLDSEDEDENEDDKFASSRLASLDRQAQLAEVARGLYMNVQGIACHMQPWVVTKVESISALDERYAAQQEELQALYYQLMDAYRRAQDNSQEMLAGERANLTEAVKDVEVTIAKLEYEINALVSRVADVEDGVAQFEIQVDAVERRADELKAQLETEGWLHWAVRTLTGIGTGPNITQEPR